MTVEAEATPAGDAGALRGGRAHWRAVGAAAVGSFGAMLGWLAWRGTPDDFYITYRYAANLAGGRGFVYNVGERAFGTSDPAWGLLLAACRWLSGADVAIVAAILFGALLGILAWRVGVDVERGSGSPFYAVLAGAGLLLASFAWSVVGAAAPLQLLLLLLAVSSGPARYAIAALTSSLAVAVRPDAALAVPIIALLFARESPRKAVAYLLCGAAIGSALLASAYAYFGTALPTTFVAKRAMATARGLDAQAFATRTAAVLERNLGAAWWMLPTVAAFGAWIAWRACDRRARFLVAYGAAVLVFYPGSGSPFFSWYVFTPFVAAMFAFFLALARGDVRLREWRAAPRALRLAARTIVAGLALVVLGGSAVAFLRDLPTPIPPRIEIYERAARWLRDNSRADQAVAYVEIGLLGYVSERPIFDLMGLVSPQASPAVTGGDILAAFRKRPTDFVLFHTRGGMAAITTSRWFEACYAPVLELEESPPQVGHLTIYRRRESNAAVCGSGV